jgi:hypothetical protein
MFFRHLSPEEEQEFRQWAHDAYKPHTEISPAWHPVIQEECAKINRDNSVFIIDNAEVEECQDSESGC